MNPIRLRSAIAMLLSVTAVLTLVAGCTGDPSSPDLRERSIRQGKVAATSDMSVTSVTPDSATQDTTLDVVINGSGFASGSVATWALAGVPDSTQVRTNSTRYVNSRQIVANITVSASAAAAKWDVIVMAAGKKGGIGTEMFTVKQRGNINPAPTDTWRLPLDTAGLAFRSDGQYSDGTHSVYANGICNVTGSIFNGSDGGSNDSGDATIQTSSPSKAKCGRVFTLAYPDGFTETLASFGNLHQLENTSFRISIGATALRRLTINPGDVINKRSPRCSKLQFGEFPNGGFGSDSVAVTRIDASTWRVQSQAWPDDFAYCETNGQLYHMQVSFLIVASRSLP